MRVHVRNDTDFAFNIVIEHPKDENTRRKSESSKDDFKVLCEKIPPRTASTVILWITKKPKFQEVFFLNHCHHFFI